ncbi:hypothetical protein ANANG_G00137740 [Anguilla anguilla]|uniref:Uncharacterized protein n=1 Tax=Anguilla anguilla TaxID=7936 RepID=A0A9D3MG92_ANGAN|nr:hypothetical protein ANANG_G00137740 [Anguilla anguilla]
MNGTNTCFKLSSLLAAWIISGLCRYSMMIVALGFYLGVSLLCLVSPVSCSAALKGLLNSHKNEESTDLHISSNANADKPAQLLLYHNRCPNGKYSHCLKSWHPHPLRRLLYQDVQYANVRYSLSLKS